MAGRKYLTLPCFQPRECQVNAAINIQVAGSAPETLNARGEDVRQTGSSRTMPTPVKREPSGGGSRVRLGAGLGNEAMQMTSL